MSHAKLATLAATVAALALSIPGSAVAASDSAPTVFNFGHCQSTGFGYAQHDGGQADVLEDEVRQQVERGTLVAHGFTDFRHVLRESRQIRLPVDEPNTVFQALLFGQTLSHKGLIFVSGGVLKILGRR